MSVTAPSDRNFRRKRVKPGSRASLRHRWKTLAVVAVAIAAAMSTVLVIARAVTTSSRLAVARVVVKGADRLAETEIEALLGGMTGANLLTLDLDAWHEKLRSSPWVQSAVIRRVFPDVVSVTVSERVAVGIGRVGDSQYLIDRTGSVIEAYGPHHADLDLPLVDGLSGGSPGMEKEDGQRALVAQRLFSALERRPDLAQRVSEIDLANPRDVVFLMNGDHSLVHAGDDHFIERLQNYVDFAETVHEKVPGTDYLDLRYGDQIVARSGEEDTVARRMSRRAAR